MENNEVSQLKEYREKIAKLSKEEQIKRDLHLKGLANGTIQGPETGFATLDKPWMKYFNDEAIMTKIPKMNVLDMVKDCNKERTNLPALRYFKKQYTFEKMYEEIDKVEKAFISMGVKAGDEVLLCMANTPEAVFCFYALSNLGAIANFVDPRSNANNMKDYIEDSKAEYIITLSDCLKTFDIALGSMENSKIKKVINVSAVESLPAPIKAIYKLKNKIPKCDIKAMSYKDFLKSGKDIEDVKPYEKLYEQDYPVAIVHTGGTTGTPKGVLLTNDNFNAMAMMHSIEDIDLKAGDTEANFVPMFTAFGLCSALHMPLCIGIEDILIPKLAPEDLDKLLVQYKPNHVLAVPVIWESLLRSKLMDDFDLSFLKSATAGADSMKIEFEKQMNDFFEKHNCKAKIGKGYGMTEVASGFTYTYDANNELGSVGAPHVKNILGMFDPDTKEEIRGYRNGEKGELAMQGPTVMKGYIGKNASETDKVLQTHADGQKWAHSADIGHMDINGSFYVDGRIKRWIIKKGFKLYASEIENIIAKHPAVQEVAVIAIPDDEFGSKAKAHIVLKKEYLGREEQIQSEIEKLCHANLPDYSYPDFYKFRDNLPVTGMSKIDFETLKLEDMESVKTK